MVRRWGSCRCQHVGESHDPVETQVRGSSKLIRILQCVEHWCSHCPCVGRDDRVLPEIDSLHEVGDLHVSVGSCGRSDDGEVEELRVVCPIPLRHAGCH